MACCGKGNKSNIPADQQKIVDAVKNSQKPSGTVVIPPASSTATKSNRSRPGTIVKQCYNCGTRTSLDTCPICLTKLI